MAATVAVLAGGHGSRIGGGKALAMLAGVPLIEYALTCAREAELNVCVVAKAVTQLPPMDARVLLEPDHPTHPLCGILTALAAYPVVIALPCDMPLLPPAVLARLAAAGTDSMLAVEGEPFPARYTAATRSVLEAALSQQASLRSVIRTLNAPALDLVDSELLFSVNSAEDLLIAERRLERTAPANRR